MCFGVGSLLFGQGRLRRTTARAQGLQIVRQFGAVAGLRSPHCVVLYAFFFLHKAFIKHLSGDTNTIARVKTVIRRLVLVSGAVSKRCAILRGQQPNPPSRGVGALLGACDAVRGRCRNLSAGLEEGIPGWYCSSACRGRWFILEVPPFWDLQ